MTREEFNVEISDYGFEEIQKMLLMSFKTAIPITDNEDEKNKYLQHPREEHLKLHSSLRCICL